MNIKIKNIVDKINDITNSPKNKLAKSACPKLSFFVIKLKTFFNIDIY